MKLKKAIKVLKFHNYWRTSNTDYLKQIYSDSEITEAIETVINIYQEIEKQVK